MGSEVIDEHTAKRIGVNCQFCNSQFLMNNCYNYPLHSTDHYLLWFVLGSNEGPVGGWFLPNGLVEQCLEEQARCAGSAPVEAEREFIQIVLQVIGANPSVVRPQKPAFE